MTDENRAVTIVDSDPHAIGSRTQDFAPPSALDLAIAAWLDTKFKHTHSTRTFTTYKSTLTQFRLALQHAGLDLDRLQTQEERDQVKQIAQAFASFSARGRVVSLATINNRYAALS